MRNETRIIHSSLKEVRRLGTDSDFPAHSPSIGARIRLNHFGGACLETHTPKLSSLIEGETFECDMSDLDHELRCRIGELAILCRSLAAELMDHAARLEAEAKSESDLIDIPDNRPESPESQVPTSASGFAPLACKSRAESRAEIAQSESRLESPSKSRRIRTPTPDLSLFD